MIRKSALVAAFCAMAALSLSSTASASLHAGSTTGTLIPTGSEIGTTSGLDGIVGSATLVTSLGSVVCSSGSLAGTIWSNSPGGATASGMLLSGFSGLSLRLCSSWYGVSSCDQVGAASWAVTMLGAVTISTLNLQCHGAFGVQCGYYAASVSGTYSNASNSVAFTNVTVNYDSVNSNVGTGTCGASGTLTVTFGPVEVLGGALNGQLVFNGT